jgi:hypothetical protein
VCELSNFQGHEEIYLETVSFFAPECAINHFLDFLKIEDEKREEKI